jgi:hypothetical protein
MMEQPARAAHRAKVPRNEGGSACGSVNWMWKLRRSPGASVQPAARARGGGDIGSSVRLRRAGGKERACAARAQPRGGAHRIAA